MLDIIHTAGKYYALLIWAAVVLAHGISLGDSVLRGLQTDQNRDPIEFANSGIDFRSSHSSSGALIGPRKK